MTTTIHTPGAERADAPAAADPRADYPALHRELRAGFDGGAYRPITARRQALKRLRAALKDMEADFTLALGRDLGKPAFESYTSEIGFCYQEIDHVLKHLRRWAAPEPVNVGLALWPTTAASYRVPKGVVLVVAPWNYPLNLALAPLISAVAAGNCVALKPAEDAPAVSAALAELVGRAFEREHVRAVEGPGAEVVPALMDAGRFDHVFYTGSTRVGRSLAERCGRELIPCTLELGGKSPVVVWDDARLEVAAQRIAWAKCFNAGQTCVAPDYALVHRDVYPAFLRKLTDELRRAYGEDPRQSPDLARMVNREHAARLARLLEGAAVAYGGEADPEARYVAPTVVTDVDQDHALLTEEVFGPVLPVLPVDDFAEVKRVIARNPNPLAAYLFTQTDKLAERFIAEVQFGGGCINDAVIHLGIPSLPFGGVQESGLGRYHADEGFRAFSNQKSIARTSGYVNPPTRYAPYREAFLKAVRLLFG